MRRYVVNICTLLCVHLAHYSKTDTCPEITGSGNLDCYTNYANRISCIWYKGSYSGNGPFLLTLIDNYYNETFRNCDLGSSPYNKSFNCDITDLTIDNMDDYKITVQDSSSAQILATIQGFEPRCNIKLDPPSDLTYILTGAAYNITWRGNSGYRGIARIQYELQLKKEASSWQESIKEQIYDSYVEILLSKFDEDSNYYIQIRCRTENRLHYESHWSEWSSELKIPIFGVQQDIIQIITIVTLLTMTLILLILALRSNLSSRINISFLKKIPTAADFFHPLYHIHNGNFQNWTNYPNKCKGSKKTEQDGFPQDIDVFSTTVLYVQKEAVSPVELESPHSRETISLTHETCNSMSWSDPLTEKEIYLNGIYPVFLSGFPSFNEDIITENEAVFSLDCPKAYVSYDSNYNANLQEITE